MAKTKSSSQRRTAESKIDKVISTRPKPRELDHLLARVDHLNVLRARAQLSLNQHLVQTHERLCTWDL